MARTKQPPRVSATAPPWQLPDIRYHHIVESTDTQPIRYTLVAITQYCNPVLQAIIANPPCIPQIVDKIAEKYQQKYFGHVPSSDICLNVRIDKTMPEEFRDELLQIAQQKFETNFIAVPMCQQKRVNKHLEQRAADLAIWKQYQAFANKIEQSLVQNNKYWWNKSAAMLSLDLLVYIFSYFEIRTLTKLCRVCKEWYRVITHTAGSVHKPLVTKLERPGMNFKTIVARYGQTITEVYQFEMVRDVALNLWFFLPNLEKLHSNRLGSTEVARNIANSCPKLKHLCLTDCLEEDWSIVPLFTKCNQLEHVECLSTEKRSFIPYLQASDLQVLANNTNGNITSLLLQRVHKSCKDEHFAALIAKCPKLENLQIVYDEISNFVKQSKTLEALQSLNKKYSRIEMNWIEPSEWPLVQTLMKDGCFAKMQKDKKPKD